MSRMESANKITAANAGGPRRRAGRTRWAARVCQFWRAPIFDPSFVMGIVGVALFVFGLSGCGRGVIKHWEDGNYLVYTRPDSREIIMGHSMGDGAILGLSETTVVSAGSDARYVVFSRRLVSGGVEHYYIEKNAGSEGEVSGPFTPVEYKAIATRLALPAYSWYLK